MFSLHHKHLASSELHFWSPAIYFTSAVSESMEIPLVFLLLYNLQYLLTILPIAIWLYASASSVSFYTTVVSPAYSEASPKKTCSAINNCFKSPCYSTMEKNKSISDTQSYFIRKIPVVYSCTEHLIQLLSAWARLCVLHRFPGSVGHRANTWPIWCMYLFRGKVFL